MIEVAPLAFMRGRAQPIDSGVLSPAGFRPIGRLRVGDLVVGSSGMPTPVLGVFPQGKKEIFRVRTEDGASTLCCAEHLWQVVDRGLDSARRVVQTNELMGALRSGEDARYELPLLAAPGALDPSVHFVRPGGTNRTLTAGGGAAVATEPRLAAPNRANSATLRHSVLHEIEPAGYAETVCIQVAAEDSLYVTDDFLVTHNSLNDSFVILDEAQNTSPEQMKMFLTRLGFGSKMVVTGDVTQIDLPRDQKLRAGDHRRDPLRGRRHRASSASAPPTWSATSSCSGSSPPTTTYSQSDRAAIDDRSR